MLIDWPESKRLLDERLHKMIRLHSHAGVVGEIPVITLYEGDRVVVIYPEGQAQEISMQSAEGSATLSKEDVAAGGADLAADTVMQLARSLGQEMDKGLLETMRNASPQHGGMFGGSDDEEMFLQLMNGLRAMDITFDEDGKPSIFFVMHPDHASKLNALNSPKRIREFEELIEEKRREWLRRESHRTLAD